MQVDNKISNYPCAAIKTAFGCSGKCTFCFCTEMNGGTYGARPMKDVVDEIEEISVAIGNARFIVQHPDTMARLHEDGVKAVMVGFEYVTDGEL